jgi:hypothetical protein
MHAAAASAIINPASSSTTHLRIKTIKAAGRLRGGALAGFYLGGSERAYPVPILTQGASWSSVRRSSELTRSHPGMSPASHVHKRGLRRRHHGVRLRGIDPDHGATLAAGGDGHVAADEEGEPAEHLLLGQLGIAADEPPDTLGELLVVGHGDDRTDRESGGRESCGAHPWRATRSGTFGVHRIYDFAAFCLPWSALCSSTCCHCPRSSSC